MRFLHYRGESPPRFAHPAERRFAELLDANGIAWEYEPRTFPLERDAEGKLVKAFTPDFYLPDVGAYIECTVMKQAYTNRKNQKVRKTRALYNAVVAIHYARDLERLWRRYEPHPRVST
jgi:hypothetical protein